MIHHRPARLTRGPVLAIVLGAALAASGCRAPEPDMRLADPGAAVPHNIYGNALVRPGDAGTDVYGFPIRKPGQGG